MRVIQKLKIQHKWEGKRNHHCEGGSQPRPHSQQLPFVFAFKKNLAGQMFHEEEEVNNDVTTWLYEQTVRFCDTGIQKLIPRLNKCIDKVVIMLKKS
jgi:hypothetical protein